MVACFQGLEEWSFEKLFRNKRVLHFAPEPAIGQLIRPWAARYQSADLLDRRHDLQIDMCRMDCFTDRALEAVIACDVLEHVPDDRQAMREIYRVLSPGGVAVLAVPQADRLKVKIELPPDASPAERLAKAGQEDHQRIYGEDFPVLLAQVGFGVRVVDQNAFSRRRIRQNGLFPPVLSANPLATNYRRIFFAQKPTE